MEEPWDELMGPSPEALKNMLRREEEELGLSSRKKPSRTRSSSSSKNKAPSVRRAPSAPPPPTMFSKLPDRWAQHEMEQQVTSSRSKVSSRSSMRSGLRASASAVPSVTVTPQMAPPPPPPPPKKMSLAFEDEGMESEGFESEDLQDEGIEVPVNTHQDAVSIRQEALKVLEVADDQLADSSYAVHRTVTGGYMASARSLGDKKRVRSALSGLSFKSNRTSARYSNLEDNDPYSAATREDYEYGDTGVVDVAGMDRRSLSSRPAKEETARSKNWSSRYSVDKTLLSLSGGSVSSGKLLDKMDRQHNEQDRRTFRNLFASSPHTKDTEVFGSGFSFRKNHVFGKQKTTIKRPEENLQTVWMDTEGSSSLPPANTRSKSWQEQLQQKRNQRRRYIIAVLAAFVLAVTLGSVLGTKKNRVNSSVGENVNVAAPVAPGSVTFYVTADAPYDLAAEDRLVEDLKSLSPQASMLVHLGNLQEASVTLCQPSRYGNLASLLKQSPVPTFVLPGQEDWNNCPNPDDAWDAWERRFGNFHRHFEHSFEVMHEAEEFENFAIINQGVLFLGLHIVGGRVWDAEEWAARNEYNYQWVEGMANTHADDVRAMVLLANARPGEPQNRDLFKRMGEYFAGYDKPVAYVHANSGMPGGTQVYSPFEQVDNVMAIQVGNNGDNPPLRLNVGFGDRPFLIG